MFSVQQCHFCISLTFYYTCQIHVTHYEQRTLIEVDQSLPSPLNPRNIIIATKNKTITSSFEERTTKKQQSQVLFPFKFATEWNNFFCHRSCGLRAFK